MNSWRTFVRVTADCTTCGSMVGESGSGDVNPNSESDRQRATRWARRHAEEYPGHLAVVESTVGRCYQAA